MADYTTNLNLKKPSGTENYNVDDQNGNMDKLEVALMANSRYIPDLGTTSNTVANIYTITTAISIPDKQVFRVKFNAAATAAATLNISSDGTARPLKKPGDSDFKPKAGYYTLIRDGENFQLLGEGGEYGTATQADTRAGTSIGTENGVLPGTATDNGPSTAETINLTSQNQEYTIAFGFHSGLRKIKAVMSGLVSGVIAYGRTVGGVLGNYTSDATATAAHILSGFSAYVKGVKIDGEMPLNSNPTTTLQINGSGKPTKTISAGYSPAGVITAELDPNLAAVIADGNTVGGVAGVYNKPLVGNNILFKDPFSHGTNNAWYYLPTIIIEKAGNYRLHALFACFFNSEMRNSQASIAIFKNGTQIYSGLGAAGIPPSTWGDWTYDLPNMVAGDEIYIGINFSGVDGWSAQIKDFGMSSPLLANAHFK